MPHLVVAIAAFIASCLTLFSGFGLGTLLMPIFALFFRVEIAVAMTAVVHGVNNILKLPLFARDANWDVVKRFGAPAILSALAGASLLGWVASAHPLAVYSIGARTAVVTPLKVTMSVVILFFAAFEILPRFRALEFAPKWLPLGGVISGFFGGLSGHQGALRAAFLAKAGLSAAAFVGTSAVIGFLVDLVRLSVYGVGFFGGALAGAGSDEQWKLVGTGVLAAFLGVLVGRRWVKKVTMRTIQVMSGTMLALVGCCLAAGLI